MNCSVCKVEESVGYHDDCKIDHYIIVKSEGSIQLEIEIAEECGLSTETITTGVTTYTLGAQKNIRSLLEGLNLYDPDGSHFVTLNLYTYTWGQAKKVLSKLNE